LHEHQFAGTPDTEIQSRIENYEMAYRMQTSIPEATDLSQEPKHILDSYGPDVATPGTFAANCLLARRLAERDVRFIQLYHQDWDHHGGIAGGIPALCKETDQPAAALVNDLDQRGLLDDTLVVWGGEFGRTNYCQGKISPNFGRDHHPRCFSIWMGRRRRETGQPLRLVCEFGLQHRREWRFGPRPPGDDAASHGDRPRAAHLQFQGRRYRLTDVHGEVVFRIDRVTRPKRQRGNQLLLFFHLVPALPQLQVLFADEQILLRVAVVSVWRTAAESPDAGPGCTDACEKTSVPDLGRFRLLRLNRLALKQLGHFPRIVNRRETPIGSVPVGVPLIFRSKRPGHQLDHPWAGFEKIARDRILARDFAPSVSSA